MRAVMYLPTDEALDKILHVFAWTVFVLTLCGIVFAAYAVDAGAA